MITVVTGYVELPNHPRPKREYEQLVRKLFNIEHSVLLYKPELEECWLHQYLCNSEQSCTHSVSDNPAKNTLGYHIVQAQKTQWIEKAWVEYPKTDVFVWIDAGIFHVPGVTAKIIDDFLARAEGERAVTIPGCWPKGTYTYDDNHPCWRFCGGVMVVPKKYVVQFNDAMQNEYVRWIEETGNVSWEVNTLARLEERNPEFPLWWYAADHDQTLFTNYMGVRS